jgi:hypothetical protein
VELDSIINREKKGGLKIKTIVKESDEKSRSENFLLILYDIIKKK